MMPQEIDPKTARIAASKKKEMEAKYQSVRLKRSRKGIPIMPGWVVNWHTFINNSVAHTVAEYQAINKPANPSTASKNRRCRDGD